VTASIGHTSILLAFFTFRDRYSIIGSRSNKSLFRTHWFAILGQLSQHAGRVF
jgi:hypothetical protein